ncbi:MAG: hypothetical protein ACT4P1_00890 [Sporichthyaceae bacterium]
MMWIPRPVAVLCSALLALTLSGCGDEDQPVVGQPAASNPPASSAGAPPGAEVDPCALITDAEVLAATKAKKLAFPPSPMLIGGFQQCEWDPLVNGQDVIRITVAYLPQDPDNITAAMGDLPGENGVGDHVRERAEARDLYLEVLNGEHYLSVSLDDNAQLVEDLPALARTLLEAAFARLA